MGKRPGLSALLSGACALWLIYDMATETEAPSQTLAIMHYVILGLCLFGFVGSLVALMRQSGS